MTAAMEIQHEVTSMADGLQSFARCWNGARNLVGLSSGRGTTAVTARRSPRLSALESRGARHVPS